MNFRERIIPFSKHRAKSALIFKHLIGEINLEKVKKTITKYMTPIITLRSVKRLSEAVQDCNNAYKAGHDFITDKQEVG